MTNVLCPPFDICPSSSSEGAVQCSAGDCHLRAEASLYPYTPFHVPPSTFTPHPSLYPYTPFSVPPSAQAHNIVQGIRPPCNPHGGGVCVFDNPAPKKQRQTAWLLVCHPLGDCCLLVPNTGLDHLMALASPGCHSLDLAAFQGKASPEHNAAEMRKGGDSPTHAHREEGMHNKELTLGRLGMRVPSMSP